MRIKTENKYILVDVEEREERCDAGVTTQVLLGLLGVILRTVGI